MRKMFVLVPIVLLASVLALGSFGTSTPVAHGADTLLSPGCRNLNSAMFDSAYNNGAVFSGAYWAGELIIVRADNDATATSIHFAFGTDIRHTSFPGGIAYVVPQNTTTATVWGVDSGNPTWDISCQAPGCDVLMSLTPDAVVGRFVRETPLYFAPGQKIDPVVTMPAGKTAWVLGKDASGAYYQIVWSCDKLWVPVNTIGPNVSDPVWQGAPLPTSVVE